MTPAETAKQLMCCGFPAKFKDGHWVCQVSGTPILDVSTIGQELGSTLIHASEPAVKESTVDLLPRNPEPSPPQTTILIGTPTLGLVRIEWTMAFLGMIIPPNWSSVRSAPTGYSTPDGQNILVDTCLRNPNTRALLLLEDDTMPPLQTCIEFDRWLYKMERQQAPPVVSGLYYIKGSAEIRRGKTGGVDLLGPEPLIYRGSGSRAFRDWTPGDVVWCDGVPTGALLVHRKVLEAWVAEPDVETYELPGYPFPLKRIFIAPARVWMDPSGQPQAASGTSDLWWSAETIRRGILKKAGWPEFAKRRYPYIVDTALRFGHIDRATGQVW